MTKREELDLFLERIDDLINSKYILADIKIVNLLKVIASSETLLAIFKNCLSGFDYPSAQKKYLVASKYLSEDKGEFITPSSSRELLAFIFNILVDIDSKKIEFSDFLKMYFFEEGSFSSAYSLFVNAMIRPFRASVKMLMESVIEGKIQDPIEALLEDEERRVNEEKERQLIAEHEKELSKKVYGESIKKIRKILTDDKIKAENSKMKKTPKEDLIYIIDMLINVVEGEDKEAIKYAFIAYKYCIKAHFFRFPFRVSKISKYVRDVINGL